MFHIKKTFNSHRLSFDSWTYTFLIYINDVSGCVKSKIKIFADDTKIYREIKDPITDKAALQSDLHFLSGWAVTWAGLLTLNCFRRACYFQSVILIIILRILPYTIRCFFSQ